MRRWNWPLWTGLLLSIAAFVSYFTVFSRWPITRDVPWFSALVFVIAIALLIKGVRRANRKILAGIVAALGVAIFAVFGFFTMVLAKQLPSASNAPRVGQKAPGFTLPDSNGRSVSLSQLQTNSQRGVLLIFYRGYW